MVVMATDSAAEMIETELDHAVIDLVEWCHTSSSLRNYITCVEVGSGK